MALTKTQICNLALSEIGEERFFLTDVDTDVSKQATICLLHYEHALQELISMHKWNCCRERAKLVDTGDTPLFGWSYEFDLPSDCIRPVRATNTDENSAYLKINIDWVVEGRIVLANHEDVWLEYVKEPTPADMNPLFATAFYTLLASKICKPLNGDDALGSEIYAKFLKVILPEAKRVNAFEGHEFPKISSDWLDATLGNRYQKGFEQDSYGLFPWG